MKTNIKKVEKLIRTKVNTSICCSEYRNSILLEGSVENWDEVIRCGKLATKQGYKGVINKIEAENFKKETVKHCGIQDNKLQDKTVDVLIIGGGIIGTSIARELSKWDLQILLIEKEEDLAMHSSSRNDGMIHPGIEAPIGSKKSIFNVRGNELYTKVAKELGVHIERCGSTVLFDKEVLKLAKPYLIYRAKKTGVKGVSLLNKEEVLRYEPNITTNFVGAVHFSTTGIVSPYKLTFAFGENAAANGVEFSFNTEALAIARDSKEIFSVLTNRGMIYPKVVINAAGVYSDVIAEMAGDSFFSIHPRKGQTLILDRKKGKFLNGVTAKPLLKVVKGNTKGGGLVKTIDGNILVGPDAYEQPYREDYSTDIENLNRLIDRHFPIIDKLNRNDIITYYSGIRAATYEEDFIIEKSDYVENLVHAAGIQSPGLASAPAIALEIERIVCEILRKKISLKEKLNWNPYRKEIPEIRNLDFKDRTEIIKRNPFYGEILCRCEEISKGEIIDALNGPLPANTLDGIKRRVRPGMGRCQGGFCTPAIMKLLSEYDNKELLEITKKGEGSNILKEEVQSFYNEGEIKDGGI